MFRETDIKELRRGLTPFPQNIFVDDQPWLADHLLPLLSIDLGILRSELAGTVVHMLSLVGPIDGYIGDGTTEFHNEFTSPNWFALQLTEDNRYRFLGQEGYFQPRTHLDEEKYAAQVKENHAKARAHAEKHGRLVSYLRSGEAHEENWLDILGGYFWAGNWVTEPPPGAFTLNEVDFPDDEDDDEDIDQVELTYQGRPFFPVACADGLTTLLFYEPESRTALFTFDYS